MAHLCVVMCTYEGERYLPEQLASILGQRVLPDSMVIVDDASTDRTVAIARDFAAHAPFPVDVHVNQRNLGFARNFERAISLAGGEVLVLCDQDDVWMKNRLERIGRVFDRAPEVAFVFSDAELVDAQLRPLSARLSAAVQFGPEERRATAAGKLFEVLVRGNVVTGATMAFRSRYRPLLLPFPPGVEHDAWTALLLSALAPVVYLDEPLIQYRQHDRNEIGAKRVGLAGRLLRARRDRTNGLATQRARNLGALERLASLPLSSRRRELLRESAEHLGVRAALPESRARRVAPVLRELAGGGYRLSRGWASAVRDLVA